VTRNDRKRASKPAANDEKLRTSLSGAHDYNQSTPVFCLHHLHRDYDVKAIGDKEGQAQLALTMHKCAQMQWKQIHQAGRHASGTEQIPADQIRAPIPPKFSDQEKFMAFRYNGKLPIVGVRINDVFHVLWVERQYGDVYDHGD
jgi:hypothetical protein